MPNTMRIFFLPLPPPYLVLLPHHVLSHVLSMFLPSCSFITLFLPAVCTVYFHGLPWLYFILAISLYCYALFELLFVCA